MAWSWFGALSYMGRGNVIENGRRLVDLIASQRAFFPPTSVDLLCHCVECGVHTHKY